MAEVGAETETRGRNGFRRDIDPAPSKAPTGLAPIVAFAGVAAALWIGAAILTVGHGLDITDEGYYLLSYRWWSSNHRAFSGVQYIYGPIFQALHYDIAGLRLFRLLTVVGTHLVFGWTFMRWLRPRRPMAPGSRLWEVAGVAAIVAAGGMVYSWLPLSPGYNDVALLGALLAMSFVLRAATHVDRGLKVPAWLPAAAGSVTIAMLLAKWASVVVLSLIAVAALVVLAPRGIREVGRVIGWALAGAVITVAFVHVLVVPLTTAVPEMLAVNRLIAGTTYLPASLLHLYWVTSADLFKITVSQHALLLLAAGVAVVGHHPIIQRLAWVLGVAGIGLSIWQALDGGGLGGGAINTRRYSVTLLAAVVFMLVTALLVVLIDRFGWVRRPPSGRSSLSNEKARGWVVLGVLIVLPLAQAAGTGNPIYTVGFNAFGVWMAIIVAVVTGIEAAPLVARSLTAAVAAAAILASACIATGGLWLHPYRGLGQAHTTSAAPGISALASVKLDPDTAEKYRLLYDRLRPYIQPEGRAIMAFDRMAGIVLLLDGRPVGEAWNSPKERARTAAGIMAECENGRPWWGSRLPILLFNRPVTDTEVRVLRRCGLDFASDYRLLAPKEETMGLQVYVPTVGAARHDQ